MEQNEIRLQCLTLAVEFGSQRDLENPRELADKYYEWVMGGSLETSPPGNRKDDRRIGSINQRSVRKGSTSNLTKRKL